MQARLPDRLYARDAVLHALVPRLVGLEYDRHRAAKREHPGDLPVVLITGVHGSGKTTVLQALARAYRSRIPVGEVDFAASGLREEAAVEVSNTSPVAEALTLLVEGLAHAVPGFGRLRFHRLLPGLLAVSSWHRGNGAEQQLARDRIARLLTACGLQKEADGDSVWTLDVVARIDNFDDWHSDLEPIADTSIRLFLTRHLGNRRRRAISDWYGQRMEGVADGVEALVRLSLWFHLGGDYRHAVERILVAALLDDLADAYTGWRHLNRAPRPLALLDNAHTAAGEQVLGLLLEHRAEPGRETRPDPLVVVAGRLDGGGGTGPYPDAVRRSLPEVATASGWSRVEGSPSAGLLIMPLPPLGRDDLLTMLDRMPREVHSYLPRALRHLTRGHPLGCRLLCDAVSEAAARGPGRGVVAPEQLLDLVTPDGDPVTVQLLEQLIPPPQLRDRLVLLSVANDREAAQALAAHLLPRSAGPLPVDQVARYLAEEQWAVADRPFVADPFLRTVLVHELRRPSGPHGARYPWQELHRVLRDHHAEREHGEADALHHTLALGDATSVVLKLTDTFSRCDAAYWLHELQHIAGAPHPPLTSWTDDRRDIARGHRDRLHPGADDLQRSVNRLLHALWYLAEPVSVPDQELCAGLRSELEFLSVRHPTGHPVLLQASREWPVAVREKRRPYPVLGLV